MPPTAPAPNVYPCSPTRLYRPVLPARRSRPSSSLYLAETLQRLGRAEEAAREAARAEIQLIGIDAPTELARARVIRAGAVTALAPVTGSRAPVATVTLTARELDIVRLIADGLGNPAMATSLGISKHTVHRHVANTLSKLGVSSRAAAVAQAARLGLL